MATSKTKPTNVSFPSFLSGPTSIGLMIHLTGPQPIWVPPRICIQRVPVPQPFPVQVQVPVPIKVTEKVEVKVPVPVKVKEPFLVRIPFPIPVPEAKKEPQQVTTPFPPTPPPFTRPPALIFHNYITEPEPKIFTVHPRGIGHHHRGAGAGGLRNHESLEEYLDEDLKKDLRDGQRAFEEGPIDPPHTSVRSWQQSGYRVKLDRGPVIPASLVKPEPIEYQHGQHMAAAAGHRPVKSFCCSKK